MNRRTGMWIAILCILAAGMGITKITSDFVSADTAQTEIAAAGNMVTAALTANVYGEDAGNGQETGIARQNMADKAAETAAGDDNSLTGGRSMAKSAPQTIVLEEVPQEEGTVTEEAEMEDTEALEDAGTEVQINVAAAESVLEEVPETVKSPLDPEVKTENYAENTETSNAYTSANISERLAQTESQASQFRESIVESNLVSAYASAEQECALWDRELNLIYNAIRSRMSKEEADVLKLSELEWLKERDIAADKTIRSAANQNQNLDYVKVMAQYTRDRCYELYEDYSDVLDRESAP